MEYDDEDKREEWVGTLLETYCSRFNSLFGYLPDREAVRAQIQGWVHIRGSETQFFEKATRAVQLVFSEEFAWVRSDQLGFLVNPRTWAKHIEPALLRSGAEVRHNKGEQSEYGARPAGSGYRRIW